MHRKASGTGFSFEVTGTELSPPFFLWLLCLAMISRHGPKGAQGCDEADVLGSNRGIGKESVDLLVL